MIEDAENKEEALLLGEAQLLLSEKRTSLSAIRTGIAVLALPLSIVSVLIATGPAGRLTYGARARPADPLLGAPRAPRPPASAGRRPRLSSRD